MVGLVQRLTTHIVYHNMVIVSIKVQGGGVGPLVDPIGVGEVHVGLNGVGGRYGVPLGPE